jgi:hypothetical protein
MQSVVEGRIIKRRYLLGSGRCGILGFPRHQRSQISTLIGEPHGTADERINLMRTAVAGAAALAWMVSSSSFALADGIPGSPGPAYARFSWTGFYIVQTGATGTTTTETTI